MSGAKPGRETAADGGRASQAEDVVALTPGWAVKTAALVGGAGGLLIAVAGLQLLIGVTFVSPAFRAIPFAHLALGAASILFAFKTFELRQWAAIGGVAVSSAIAIGGGTWLVFAVSSGILSLLGMIVPFTAVGGAVFSGLAIGPCRRAGAARARMFEGMQELY